MSTLAGPKRACCNLGRLVDHRDEIGDHAGDRAHVRIGECDELRERVLAQLLLELRQLVLKDGQLVVDLRQRAVDVCQLI